MAQGLWSSLRTLAGALSPRRRREAIATFALLLLGAFAEVVSLGAVLPFLAILIDLDAARRLPVVGPWIAAIPSGADPIATATAAFLSLLVISGGLRLYLSWRSLALVNAVSYDLTLVAFRKAIRQPYAFYLGQNSSRAIAGFDMVHHVTTAVLQAAVQALTAGITAAALIVALLAIDPLIAGIGAATMIGVYILVSLAVRATLDRNSRAFADAWARRVKAIQEAIGGIRNIILDRSQAAFETGFERDIGELRRSVTVNSYIAQFPRIVMEVIAVALIAGLVWYLASRPAGLVAAIPELGALAACGQRLLPLLQSTYYGWSQLRGSEESLLQVSAMLELPDAVQLPLDATGDLRPFAREVRLEGVGFEFLSGHPVLRDVALTIAKGERVGIVGPSGAGKSTLMDLLLGLLDPGEGRIAIDGRPLAEVRGEWQRQVAHVPQSIFLADDTLAANIAFGVAAEQVDTARVEQAAFSAGISAFIDTLPAGYATRCGERGIRLSGGQRQRIGIARALYRQARFLILDEATSALDSATEREVIAAIEALGRDITVVTVAHRESTVANCDRIVHLEQGRIARIETRARRLVSAV